MVKQREKKYFEFDKLKDARKHVQRALSYIDDAFALTVEARRGRIEKVMELLKEAEALLSELIRELEQEVIVSYLVAEVD